MADAPNKSDATKMPFEPEAMSATDKVLMSILEFNNPGPNGIELNHWCEAAAELGISVDTLKKNFDDAKKEYREATKGVIPTAAVIKRRKRVKRDDPEADGKRENDSDNVPPAAPVPKRQRMTQNAHAKRQAKVGSGSNSEAASHEENPTPSADSERGSSVRAADNSDEEEMKSKATKKGKDQATLSRVSSLHARQDFRNNGEGN
ncbi:hypothetical protein PG987_015596 [Apiospora arundinis]